MLVTDVAYPLEPIRQLYRDRADAQNAFVELKNLWDLGGFAAQVRINVGGLLTDRVKHPVDEGMLIPRSVYQRLPQPHHDQLA